MKKANKGLIASLFKWIGFPWSKVRWRTNVAVLLLDFLYKMFDNGEEIDGKDDGKDDGEDDNGDRFDYIIIHISIFHYPNNTHTL